MNGDEDLKEDIIMKGEPYHYQYLRWGPLCALTYMDNINFGSTREYIAIDLSAR